MHDDVTETPGLKCDAMKAHMTSAPKETCKHGQGGDLFVAGLVQHVSASGMMWAHILGLLNASAGGGDSLRAGSKAVWPLPCSAQFPTRQLTTEVSGAFDV